MTSKLCEEDLPEPLAHVVAVVSIAIVATLECTQVNSEYSFKKVTQSIPLGISPSYQSINFTLLPLIALSTKYIV